MLMSIDRQRCISLTVLFRGHVVPMFDVRDNFCTFNLRGFELCKDHCTVQTRCLFERLPSTVYTMTKPIIIIEGNIGAGKSTLSKQLAASMRYALFQEPTTGNPYLEKYYSQPKVYALP